MPLTGAAAARLYDDHVDAVYELIARRVGSAAATEVTAQAFELALRSWDEFDVTRGTERHFVYGAAISALRQHDELEQDHLLSLRLPASTAGVIDDPLVASRSEPRPRVVEHSSNRDLRPDSNVDSAPDDPDHIAIRTMSAVAELEPEDRDILLLSLWESCSQGAISEILGLSIGTIRSSLGRIRRELKLAVEDDDR